MFAPKEYSTKSMVHVCISPRPPFQLRCIYFVMGVAGGSDVWLSCGALGQLHLGSEDCRLLPARIS